ncbi:MAG: tetratricopeptide repeat protein [Caldilineaceae bacterium]|nr:tetratricopeptide repeat protein [Caldilineaceae bacterium]
MSAISSCAAYIPLDRRFAMMQGATLPDRAYGAALFADISGFTQLTETLAARFGARRGADELARHLNRVYTVLIAEVHRLGGSVIGFSGDAIMCWFAEGIEEARESGEASTEKKEASEKSGDAAANAVRVAVALQQAMQQFVDWEIVTGVRATLTIKTAVATGAVRRLLVGDADIQVIDILAGALMDRVAAAEQLAHPGDLVLDETTANRMAGALPAPEWHTAESTRFAIYHSQATHPSTSPLLYSSSLLPSSFTPPLLTLEQLRPWLLPTIYERLINQHDRYLAELRPAVALFVKFGGIDYDQDPGAGEKLDAFIRWVQGVLARYEGALIQLTTGDKGSYLYAAFGAPIAHDDDLTRAVAVALDLRAAPQRFDFVTYVQMGIAQGRMRVGAYGSETRRTYGVLGDATNLAARLMSSATPGQILTVQAVADDLGQRYFLEELGLRTFKGKTEPQPVFNIVQAQMTPAPGFESELAPPLVGRVDELAQVEALMAQVVETQRGHILRMQGEAGVGKSLLAATAVQRAPEQGLQPVIGACQSINRDTAWFPIRQMARTLLRLPATQQTLTTAEQQAQIEQLSELVEWMNPEWLLRLPLLGDLLGLPIADNATTAAFDAQLRREALIALALEILQTRARAQPLLLLIEDAHWMDEASQAILLALGRVIADVPILLMLVQRPPTPDNERFLGEVASLPHQTLLPLAELSAEGVAALVANRLGSDQVPPLALALVQALAQGNPFYIEELLDALQDAERLLPFRGGWTLSHDLINQLEKGGCLTRVNDEWTLRPDANLSAVELGIPDSIHGIVLARLDRLPEPVKLTIKAASVIGRIFELDLLAAGHPNKPEPPQLLSELELLLARDFARAETPQVSYIFKHNITQEVVYRTLLEEQRHDLHAAVGHALETLQPDQSERLAHHFYNGDLNQPTVRQNALRYLGLAGDRAKREYANETALTYYDRALGLDVRWPWLKSKVEVLHILGHRDEERDAIAQLAAALDAPAREAALLWSDYYESISDYPQAQQAANRGLDLARAENDAASQARFQAKLGMIAWRQGDYDGAEGAYRKVLDVINNSSDLQAEKAEAHYGLALVYRQQGKYDESKVELQQDLKINQSLSNRKNQARTLNALGVVNYYHRIFGEALSQFREALAIRQSIGDRFGEAASTLSIAQVLGSQGDHGGAEPLLKHALKIQEQINDAWHKQLILNELGILYMMVGDWSQARLNLKAGLKITEEIGSESGKAYILCNLGQVLRDSGQIFDAEKHLLICLQLAQTLGNEHLEAICLGDIAFLYLQQKRIHQAIEYARDSLQKFHLLNLDESTTSVLLTIAMANSFIQNQQEAETNLNDALKILRESSTEELDFPHRDYWMCCQVFRHMDDEEAATRSLHSAYNLLMERANRISDPIMRQSFLENVPHNREILEAVQHIDSAS